MEYQMNQTLTTRTHKWSSPFPVKHQTARWLQNKQVLWTIWNSGKRIKNTGASTSRQSLYKCRITNGYRWRHGYLRTLTKYQGWPFSPVPVTHTNKRHILVSLKRDTRPLLEQSPLSYRGESYRNLKTTCR